MTLLRARLASHGFVRSRARDPVDVVSWMGAVQAQDFPGARWGVGLRATGVTEAHVERAFNAGSILRTHVLRPTWHLVTSRDIRWLTALTGPRVLASLASRHRQLELDQGTVARSLDAFAGALEGGTFLTRTELAAALGRAGIRTTPERVAHLLMIAELEARICSGPLRTRELTYALLDERVRPSSPIARDEALVRLAERYFASHGPATAADFAWWSGLTLGEARLAVEMAKPAISVRPSTRATRRSASLLPAFDEYLVAYRDRSAVLGSVPLDLRDALGPTVIVDGRAAAGWRRRFTTGGVVIELLPRRKLTRAERDAVHQAAERYGAFVGRAVVQVSTR